MFVDVFDRDRLEGPDSDMKCHGQDCRTEFPDTWHFKRFSRDFAADLNGFDQNIYKIANDYLDNSIRKMESISGTLNSLGILLVSAIIGWVVLGTFQMQDQITAALT